MRQSGIAHPRYIGDGLGEFPPALSLRLENGETCGRDGVVAPASLAVFFDPTSDDPLSLFHAIEHGIEGGDVEREHAVGPALDELGELVAMSWLVLDQREDEKLGASLLELGSQHGVIYVSATYVAPESENGKITFLCRRSG